MIAIRKRALELALGFAIGMSWVFAFAVGIFAFFYIYPFGLLSAFAVSIVSFAVALIPAFVFEAVYLILETHSEKQKQTKLLELIDSKLDLFQNLLVK